MKILRTFVAIFALAVAWCTPTYAQNPGTGDNHAFMLGRGPNVTGYRSLTCTTAQLAVGQAGADPICRTISGDALFAATGVLTLSTVNANVGSWGTATQVPQFTVDAKGRITAVANVALTIAIGSVTGLGAGCATWLGTPSSANLRGCVTDETGTGLLYFQGGDIGTPSAGVGTNLTALNATQLTGGTVPAARFPALTGDCTTSAGAVATTCTKINGVDQTVVWPAYACVLASEAGGALGSGNTLDCTWKQIGKTACITGSITMGATGVGTATQISVSLPATANKDAILVGRNRTAGLGVIGDIGFVALTKALLNTSATGALGLVNSQQTIFSGCYGTT